MDEQAYVFCALAAAIAVICYLVEKLRRVRGQLSFMSDMLKDIKNGNFNRRMLARKSDLTKQICYDMNEIAANSQQQLIRQKQAEQTYKRLMTSLSHDVKTPLASLVGYLEAVEEELVSGKERDEYIHVAFEKAQSLKHLVENLFEWVKLDSGEQIFHFKELDLNELSRGLIADWIPVLENSGFTYEIDIPETEYFMGIDENAYMRILNNLFQNVLIHSQGSYVSFRILEDQKGAKIVIADNGKGILPENLPHIFERMYQCDHSRSGKGNGLGLAITKELITAHRGVITASSVPLKGTEFIIWFPKAL